jgi:recombination protein RecA
VQRKKMIKRHSVSRSPIINNRDLLTEYSSYLSKKGVVEVLSLSDDDCLAHIKLRISTQSIVLDKLLDGGVPTGRVTEIYGPAHIGKSTILDHIFSSVQQLGGIAILIDTEGARDPQYSKNIGVNINQLQMIEFTSEELYIENVVKKIFDTIDFWKKKAPDLPIVIGWDALGGTATQDELEKRLEKDLRPAKAAQIMRQAGRQLPSKLGNTKIAVVIINHEYDTFSTGWGSGPRKETYGGGAVKYLSSIRMRVYHVGYIDGAKGVRIGRRVGVTLDKNRLGDPFSKVEFALLSSVGIDNTYSVYEALTKAGVIVVSGAWAAINLDGEIIKFQGWNGLMNKCLEDITLFSKLVSVYNSLSLGR